MIKRKGVLKYYFSVEGETEKWYLEWLQTQINSTPSSEYNVSFNIQIQKDPLKRAKALPITERVEIWHLSDYESEEEIKTVMLGRCSFCSEQSQSNHGD